MNKRRVGRAAIVTVPVAGAGVTLFAVPASAVPKRRQCDTIEQNIIEEDNWANYFHLLGDGYAAQGNSAAAASNYDTAIMFRNLAIAGQNLEGRLGC